MFNKKYLIAIVALVAIAGSMGIVAAEHSGPHVDPSNSDATGNYSTIQNAVDNASDGDTIKVEPGTYNETVDVGTNNLTVQSNSAEMVYVNGSFNTSEVSSFTLGENVTVNSTSSSDGGGGVGVASAENALTTTYFGAPLWIILIFAAVLVIIGYVEYKDGDYR